MLSLTERYDGVVRFLGFLLNSLNVIQHVQGYYCQISVISTSRHIMRALQRSFRRVEILRLLQILEFPHPKN